MSLLGRCCGKTFLGNGAPPSRAPLFDFPIAKELAERDVRGQAFSIGRRRELHRAW
jgi:hypothetical protein